MYPAKPFYHITEPIGFGDLAIPIQENDSFLFRPAKTTVPADLKRAVFKFKDGGTGFLISISEMQINRVTKKFGLLLTASHVILDPKKGKLKDFNFSCKLEGYKEKAYLIKEFSNSKTSDHICSTTKSLYCMPGDIAILLVTLNNCRSPEYFEPLDLSFTTSNLKCFISGFPKKVNKFNFYNPYKNLPDTQINEISRKIFNKHKGLVHSYGSVINENETLVEISCSTTNGMSGSPIISQGKYIGVYVGGQALPGQKELVDVMKLVVEGNYDQAMQVLKSMICYDKFYEYEAFKNFIIESQWILFRSEWILKSELPIHEMKNIKNLGGKNKPKKFKVKEFLKSAYSLLRDLVWNYKQRLSHCANLGISYKNDVFREVDFCVEFFLTCKERSFSCIDELLDSLSSS